MKIYLLISTLIILSCNAQNKDYHKILKELDSDRQSKLDTGNFMLETEREYALKLYSLTKVIYVDLSNVKNDEELNLDVEQNKWEVEYKSRLKKIWSKLEEANSELGFISNDDKMFAYSEQAQLTQKRILELINEFN